MKNKRELTYESVSDISNGLRMLKSCISLQRDAQDKSIRGKAIKRNVRKKSQKKWCLHLDDPNNKKYS